LSTPLCCTSTGKLGSLGAEKAKPIERDLGKNMKMELENQPASRVSNASMLMKGSNNFK
jgi:hypothetical protein